MRNGRDGSFSYTKETHQLTLGPIDLSVQDRETINVPVWAGVGAIVVGGVLLLLGKGKRWFLMIPDYCCNGKTSCCNFKRQTTRVCAEVKGPLGLQPTFWGG